MFAVTKKKHVYLLLVVGVPAVVAGCSSLFYLPVVAGCDTALSGLGAARRGCGPCAWPVPVVGVACWRLRLGLLGVVLGCACALGGAGAVRAAIVGAVEQIPGSRTCPSRSSASPIWGVKRNPGRNSSSFVIMIELAGWQVASQGRRPSALLRLRLSRLRLWLQPQLRLNQR